MMALILSLFVFLLFTLFLELLFALGRRPLELLFSRFCDVCTVPLLCDCASAGMAVVKQRANAMHAVNDVSLNCLIAFAFFKLIKADLLI